MNMHVFGWWKEAGVPEGNPHRQGEHANSTKKGPKPGPEQDVLCTHGMELSSLELRTEDRIRCSLRHLEF